MTLFGFSLTGNLDVDDNQFPDLAVGSHSDSVFVFRYRYSYFLKNNIFSKHFYKFINKVSTNPFIHKSLHALFAV